MVLLPIHIVAGLTGLIAGAIALIAYKGGTWHRRVGLVFVVAMLTMASVGALMAIVWHPNRLNVIAGTLTIYLVSTALFTVRRPGPKWRWLNVAAFLVGLGVGIAGITFGIMGSTLGSAAVDDMPAPAFYVFGTVALLASVGDIRMLTGGVSGASRITRHLWRMCLAMFIATASFFLGQADEFPEQIRRSGILSIPVLLVVVTTLYWWIRVAFTKWYEHDYLKIPVGAPIPRPVTASER